MKDLIETGKLLENTREHIKGYIILIDSILIYRYVNLKTYDMRMITFYSDSATAVSSPTGRHP